MNKRRPHSWLFLVWLITSLFAFPFTAQAQTQPGRQVALLHIEGAINPAMAEYISRGLQVARQEGAQAAILQINTPGGSIDVMNRIVDILVGSPVPVITYVAPEGAMAGSAGTLITLAGNLIGMAPGSAIGAASPVGPSGQDLSTTEADKVKNILKATARSLAAPRGEKAVALADSTIDSAQAASANEALQAGLIDAVAASPDELLSQLDGKTITFNKQPLTLHTRGAQIVPVNASLIEQLLGLLTNPNLVFVLLNVGVVSILIELSSPGGWVAGTVGVISLALAAYGLDFLPVNWFGIIFLVLAFVLFILDIKAPTHGALTLAGTISFVIGALVLFNSPSVPTFQRVSVPLVLTMAALTAGMFFAILTIALRAQRRPVITGQTNLIGQTGIARTQINPKGQVHVNGEQWSAELAEGSEPIPMGEPVVVVGFEGLHVKVRRAV